MARLRRVVTQVATTPDSHLRHLPLLHRSRSLVPLLSSTQLQLAFSSNSTFPPPQGLPMRAHSETLAACACYQRQESDVGREREDANDGVRRARYGRSWGSTAHSYQGYAGGDEAKMLHRHLLQTSTKIGVVGVNRRAIAASVLERYGHMDSYLMFEKLSSSHRSEPGHENKKVVVVILDDGMQVQYWVMDFSQSSV